MATSSERPYFLRFLRTATREFPTPSGGVNPPNFRTTSPGFRAKGGREGKGREGEREGRGEGKGRDPKSWLTPHVPNPEKYPDCDYYARVAGFEILPVQWRAVGHWTKCTTYEPPVTQVAPNRISPNACENNLDIVAIRVVLVFHNPSSFLRNGRP